jgi:hypothetical protein
MTGKLSSETEGAAFERQGCDMKQTPHNAPAYRAGVSPRIFAQVKEVHRRAAAFDARGVGIFERRLRRERRNARQAEADLLRGLGYASYEDFMRSTVLEAAPRQTEAADIAEIAILHTRIAALEEELAEAKFAIKSVLDRVEASRSAAQASGVGDEADELRDALHDAAREVTLFAEVVRRERAELYHARDVVIAITRDARVTVEGLRRIAELEGPAAS